MKRKLTGDPNSRPTQCDRIYRHLCDGRSITSAEAMHEYGIMSLPKRMSELQLQYGVVLKKEQVCDTNRYGEPVYYIRYSLDQTVAQPQILYK